MRAALHDDLYLRPYLGRVRERAARVRRTEDRLTRGGEVSLADFASGHEYFGLHRRKDGWVFREWAPAAASVFLVGDFSGWDERPAFALRRIDGEGTWQIDLPADSLGHGDLYRLRLHWQGGCGDRIPAYARRAVQDQTTKIFNAQVWAPREPYRWRHASPDARFAAPAVYEAHAGMAQEEEGIGTYARFRETILPRIVDAGYDTLQLMAVLEHPYYGSFGYHVTSYFAASSRFGTPEEFKQLVDEAHGLGLAVIIDLVHSHAANNVAEGLSCFDGTPHQYFHAGERGYHRLWDSRCFDYGKPEVLHFLLSNCRFWLDEYRVDGFRFDGITSMLYLHHGLGVDFVHYDQYFDDTVDEDALAYLALANGVIHQVAPGAITIAEDMSGMPGLGAPRHEGGCGFDYRLAMGVPECWFKLVRETRDEDWPMGRLWHELTNRRADERTISYVECHDQAIVGGKTAIFELLDAAMYTDMHVRSCNPLVDRAVALHMMMRLATLGTAGCGYLNFMGNEFGHPEWIDFPREGNAWSFHYARRQWHLRADPELRYRFLADFDRDMLLLVRGAGVLCVTPPRLLTANEEDKILAFSRGSLLFLLNFHPHCSVSDYRLPAPAGEYRLALDTDSACYGGQGRVQPGQSYFTRRAGCAPGETCLQVYLPCRTALVLQSSCATGTGVPSSLTQTMTT